MAKKSAKSKGYRKQVEKKPYLSRRDIVILCVILAIVAVGAILLFTYDDGALKVKDGKIVDAGENWLIVNGNARGRRYFKLGEIGDIDGYTRENRPFVSDENLNQFVFTPEGESAILDISVSASAYDPARLAEGNMKMVSSVKDTRVSDIATAAAGDSEYTWYSYSREYYAAEEPAEGDAAAESAEGDAAAESAEGDAAAESAGETSEEPAGETSEEASEEASEAPNHFEQALNAYVPAPRNGSFVIAVTAEAPDADSYLTDDQLLEAVEQAIAAITPESEK